MFDESPDSPQCRRPTSQISRFVNRALRGGSSILHVVCLRHPFEVAQVPCSIESSLSARILRDSRKE
jgi:hypothetical protein